MDHSIAIECLKDDLEQAKKDANYLAQGISEMGIRIATGERIRESVLLRWRSRLADKQNKVRALRASIKYLEQHSTGGN